MFDREKDVMLSSTRTFLTGAAQHSGACFRIVFAGGSNWQSRDGEPAFTLVFRDRRAERRILLFGHVGLIESYFCGDLDIEGSLQLAFRSGMEMGIDKPPGGLLKLRNAWHEWRFGNGDHSQAKANARFHYGLGADFYGLWLDRPGRQLREHDR